jgi:methyl-accepting chemotaxis protein
MVTYQAKNRRKNYFIKKEFQSKFILKFCALVVLTALISAFMIYHFSSQSVTTVFENSRLSIKPSTEFITPGLILSGLIAVVIVGIATTFVVLFVSHRIAGPLYKLESALERVAGGDLSFDIHFRQKDEAKKMAEVFNKTSRNLNRLVSNVKAESNKLHIEVKELQALIKKLPTDEQVTLIAALEKLEGISDDLKEELNRFKLR